MWSVSVVAGVYRSDRSKVSLDEHHHITFNANGDVTIEFD